MTVKLEGQIKRFSGLSDDIKSMPQAQGGSMADGEILPAGSSFLELDTGRIYRWDGDTRWVTGVQEHESSLLLRAIVAQLHLLIGLSETIVEILNE
jgi:hypothetical protein